MKTAEVTSMEGESAEAPRLLRVSGGDPQSNLAELLSHAGHPLNTRCGQRGLCRGCMVELLEGELTDADGSPHTSGLLRACRMRIAGDSPVVISVPHQARISNTPQVSETYMVDVPCTLDPSIPAAGPRDTGFALDLGTTTVVLLLVDLNTGAILSRAGAFNAQIRFGDNVITRIGVGADPEKRRGMRRAFVMETLRPLLDKALQRAGRELDRIAGGVIAGNTTMLHILADVDTAPLGVAPFQARFLDGRMEDATAFGFDEAGLPGDVPIRLLPGISAYVGADIVAGVQATGMTLDAEPSLLVDMGTNGEIVLCVDGRLIACATAAGPAFEGAGLTSGTRAHAGAISRIRIDGADIAHETIGNIPVANDGGICGSAYIDFLSDARRCELLRPNGRFDREAWARLPEGHRFDSDDGIAFRPAAGRNPRISEVDIAQLLQAKAAIGAGIEILLSVAGTDASRIGRVHLAGGFGMHVDVAHAIAIGLLPGFKPEQVSVVGNTSLAGALIGLLDQQSLSDMEDFRSRVEIVELNLQPGFEDTYIDHLSLP